MKILEPGHIYQCLSCGESPDSVSHGFGLNAHTYVDPRRVVRLVGDDPDLVRRGPPRRR